VPSGCPNASDGFPDFSAIEAREPVEHKRYHRCLAQSRKIIAEFSGDFDRAQWGAGNVGENGGFAGRVGVLEDQFVTLQAKSIAGQFERAVVVAAEPKFLDGVEMPSGQFWVELQLVA